MVCQSYVCEMIIYSTVLEFEDLLSFPSVIIGFHMRITPLHFRVSIILLISVLFSVKQVEVCPSFFLFASRQQDQCIWWSCIRCININKVTPIVVIGFIHHCSNLPLGLTSLCIDSLWHHGCNHPFQLNTTFLEKLNLADLPIALSVGLALAF